MRNKSRMNELPTQHQLFVGSASPSRIMWWTNQEWKSMAKQHRPAVNASTLTGFSRKPQASDTSYSGDKPNPHLRSFVEAKGTPYDPATDAYNVPAFNQPIE